MSKLQLPTVTLICVDCINPDKAIKVLNHCNKMVDFGDVKLLTSVPIEYEHCVRIQPLTSLIQYSVFMLTEFHKYIDTEMCLIIQCDGWILNPQSFDMEWLNLDYIGGLYMQYDKVGSGGFSLRSKKIMEYAAQITPKWDGSQKQAEEITKWYGYYEDGAISLSGKFNQFKIATLEQAANFAMGGNRNPLYFREYPFGFHRNFSVINFKTGHVDTTDLARDISVSYDFEIEGL